VDFPAYLAARRSFRSAGLSSTGAGGGRPPRFMG
jgi:hypothetical protein